MTELLRTKSSSYYIVNAVGTLGDGEQASIETKISQYCKRTFFVLTMNLSKIFKQKLFYPFGKFTNSFVNHLAG